MLTAVFLVSVTSCRVFRLHEHRKVVVVNPNSNGVIPPGQLKKATGAKSAKEYAPGQNKPLKAKGKKNKKR